MGKTKKKERKSRSARTSKPPAKAKPKPKPKPESALPLCPRCGKGMMLVSQGHTWKSYVCRTCGIGRVLAS